MPYIGNYTWEYNNVNQTINEMSYSAAVKTFENFIYGRTILAHDYCLFTLPIQAQDFRCDYIYSYGMKNNGTTPDNFYRKIYIGLSNSLDFLGVNTNKFIGAGTWGADKAVVVQGDFNAIFDTTIPVDDFSHPASWTPTMRSIIKRDSQIYLEERRVIGANNVEIPSIEDFFASGDLAFSGKLSQCYLPAQGFVSFIMKSIGGDTMHPDYFSIYPGLAKIKVQQLDYLPQEELDAIDQTYFSS